MESLLTAEITQLFIKFFAKGLGAVVSVISGLVVAFFTIRMGRNTEREKFRQDMELQDFRHLRDSYTGYLGFIVQSVNITVANSHVNRKDIKLSSVIEPQSAQIIGKINLLASPKVREQIAVLLQRLLDWESAYNQSFFRDSEGEFRYFYSDQTAAVDKKQDLFNSELAKITTLMQEHLSEVQHQILINKKKATRL